MSEKEGDTEEEVIQGPQTSVSELENGIFTLVITLVNQYINQGYSKEDSSKLVASLLGKYVSALQNQDA